MRIFQILALPFALLYKGITSTRNFLFNIGILSSTSPKVFSIGVGNLTAGGTGKTPVVNFLIKLFQNTETGVISRGYGRKTSGFIKITAFSTCEQVGDEPKMLFDKNKDLNSFVSENRVEGAKKALQENNKIKLLLFDDIFQHRYLKPSVSILLCNYQRPFYKDFLIPSGLLRESRNGAKRAQIVLITKCIENLENSEKYLIENKIRKYAADSAKIYFSTFKNSEPISILKNTISLKSEVYLVSALANNSHFFSQINTNYKIKKHFSYKDHFSYKSADIERIIEESNGKPIITTEKDFVKIKEVCDELFLNNFYVVYQELVFLEKENEFKKDIFDAFDKYYSI